MKNLKLICLLILTTIFNGAAFAKKTEPVSYEKFFDNSIIHSIDIIFNDDDWEKLKVSALDKKKFHANLVIDGEPVNNVAVSAKGSSSLRKAVSHKGASRFSLKIQFDKYEKKQSFYGLDSLTVANCFTDPSLMKNYLVYEMFRRNGVPAPLAGFAKITVNGQLYGTFAIVEEYGEGFLKRNFDDKGKLYKPEPLALAELNKKKAGNIKNSAQKVSATEREILFKMFESIPSFTNGADLCYKGEDFAFYPEIFNNAEFKISDSDKKRVVCALKNLSEGNIKKSLDYKLVLKYFAIHNFTCNMDSYVSKLCHNYYLYENKGRLSMLPWDYDYYDSLSTNESPVAYKTIYTDRVELNIDSPLHVEEESRPMWSWIVKSPSYKNQYHKYVKEFMDNCLENGWADSEIDRVYNMIKNNVAEDPVYLYGQEEFEAAVKDLHNFIGLRSSVVNKQLKGN